MLEIYYSFFRKVCGNEKYEELEMDTDSLYLSLSKRTCKILFSKGEEMNGKQYVCEIVQIASLRMQRATSSQEHVVLLTRIMIRESRDCLKENSGVPKCCVCEAKSIVAAIERVTSTNSVARDSIIKLWKAVEMKVSKSVRGGSQRYFNQQRISDIET